MSVEEVLLKSQVFSGLSLEDIQEIAKIAQEQTYRPGEMIFQEGNKALNLHVLLEGKVALEMALPGLVAHWPPRKSSLRVATPGASFGLSAVVEPRIYTLSARCVEACRSVAVDSAKLKAFLDKNPQVGYQVMKRVAAVISSRLRDTRKMLISE